MAHFVDEPENIYHFDIEEKCVGSVAICANSFDEAYMFLIEQYGLHKHETQKFFNLYQCPTSFIDDNGNKHLF